MADVEPSPIHKHGTRGTNLGYFLVGEYRIRQYRLVDACFHVLCILAELIHRIGNDFLVEQNLTRIVGRRCQPITFVSNFPVCRGSEVGWKKWTPKSE